MENKHTPENIAHKWLGFFAPRVGWQAPPNIISAMKDYNKPFRDAIQEFVDRVDNGEIKSTRTYAKFKELLKSATST